MYRLLFLLLCLLFTTQCASRIDDAERNGSATSNVRVITMTATPSRDVVRSDDVQSEPVRLAASPTASHAESVLAVGERALYVVAGEAGDILVVALTAAEDHDAALTIATADNRILTAPAVTRWAGQLAETESIVLTVSANNQPLSYELDVAFPPVLQPEQDGVVRIASGLSAAGREQFAWSGVAGEQFTVAVVAPADDVLLTISGLSDELPLLRAAAGLHDWQGTLPTTQPYLIQVISVGEATGYTLSVRGEP